MNRDIIESFAAGAETLRRAVDGLTQDDLLARPGPGDWSIQELVIHVADSDDIAIDRMKRILTEDNPDSPLRRRIGLHHDTSCPTNNRSRMP